MLPGRDRGRIFGAAAKGVHSQPLLQMEWHMPDDERTLDPADWYDYHALARELIDTTVADLKDLENKTGWRPLGESDMDVFPTPLPLEGQGLRGAYQDFVDFVKPFPFGQYTRRFSGPECGVQGSTARALSRCTVRRTRSSNSGGPDAQRRLRRVPRRGWSGARVAERHHDRSPRPTGARRLADQAKDTGNCIAGMLTPYR